MVNRRWFWLALIVLSGTMLRAYCCHQFPAVPAGDALDYQNISVSISHGTGFPDENHRPSAYRPPLFPIFLAGVYSLAGGPDIPAALTAQALLGGISVLLVIWLASLIFGVREALISGMITALYPTFIYLPRTLLSENLALPLVLSSLVLVHSSLRTPTAVKSALLGLVLGLGFLCRGSFIFFIAFLFLGFLFFGDRRIASLKRLLLTFVVLISIVSPWTIRNYRMFHQLVPVTTEIGKTIYASYWPPERNSKRIWGNVATASDPAIRNLHAADEAEESHLLVSLTVERLKKTPFLFFKLIPEKIAVLITPFDWETFPDRNGSSRHFNYGYALLLIVSAVGLAFQAKGEGVRKLVRQTWPMGMLALGILAQTIVFYGSPRFRSAGEVILVIYATHTVSKLIRRVKPALE